LKCHHKEENPKMIAEIPKDVALVEELVHQSTYGQLLLNLSQSFGGHPLICGSMQCELPSTPGQHTIPHAKLMHHTKSNCLSKYDGLGKLDGLGIICCFLKNC